MSNGELASVPTIPAASDQYVLTLLVCDRGSALERILGVLRRRGPSFSTVNVATSEERQMARITISLQGTRQAADQAIEHLRKIVDVRWATVVPASGANEGPLLREFALVRVACDAQTRREVMALAQTFAARVVDVADSSLTLEASGPSDTIEQFVHLLRPIGIRDLARTGRLAI